MQFKVFEVFGLLILEQRYINKFFALSSLENKARFLLGLKIFATNCGSINGFVGENKGLLHRLLQLYCKADNTVIFICSNTRNFDRSIQRLRHHRRGTGVGVIVDVHPIKPEHQLGGLGNIGSQYGGARLLRIEDSDRRPFNLRPADEPDWHTCGAFHPAVQHH